jgi:hypothetical protein
LCKRTPSEEVSKTIRGGQTLQGVSVSSKERKKKKEGHDSLVMAITVCSALLKTLRIDLNTNVLL